MGLPGRGKRKISVIADAFGSNPGPGLFLPTADIKDTKRVWPFV